MNVADNDEGLRVNRLDQQAEPADFLSGNNAVHHVFGLFGIGSDRRDQCDAAFHLCGNQLGNLRSIITDDGERFGGISPS